MDVLVGCVCCIETNSAADFFHNNTVLITGKLVLSLETAEFKFNSFSYLQVISPFFACLNRQNAFLDFLASDEDALFAIVIIGNDEVSQLAGFDGTNLVVSTQCLSRVIR